VKDLNSGAIPTTRLMKPMSYEEVENQVTTIFSQLYILTISPRDEDREYFNQMTTTLNEIACESGLQSPKRALESPRRATGEFIFSYWDLPKPSGHFPNTFSTLSLISGTLSTLLDYELISLASYQEHKKLLIQGFYHVLERHNITRIVSNDNGHKRISDLEQFKLISEPLDDILRGSFLGYPNNIEVQKV
tara:strand:+ start:491 stop:1063 length:573 start_codon:yes stop_codon:yes gene_type:complete